MNNHDQMDTGLLDFHLIVGWSKYMQCGLPVLPWCRWVYYILAWVPCFLYKFLALCLLRTTHTKSKIIRHALWVLSKAVTVQIVRMKLGSRSRRTGGFSEALKEQRSKLYIISRCVVMLIRWHDWRRTFFLLLLNFVSFSQFLVFFFCYSY